jgi:hypothetical protein
VGTLEKELWDLFVLPSFVNRGRWNGNEVNVGKPNNSGVERYPDSTKLNKYIILIITIVLLLPLNPPSL